MSRILAPSAGPDDWKRLLASADHWRTGYSARSLAHSWHDAAGDFPSEIRSLLDTSPLFTSAELLLAVPEHKVPLPGVGKASQTDLWFLGRTESALVSCAVEGKVAEPFGPTIEDWLAEGGDNRAKRLTGLCQLLGIESVDSRVRYQLIHRTASAILEAKRFLARHALLIVHSFSQADDWYDDFATFAQSLGAVPAKGRLVQVPGRTEPTLHIGWARGAARFAEA